jgi:hypothetical protein
MEPHPGLRFKLWRSVLEAAPPMGAVLADSPGRIFLT